MVCPLPYVTVPLSHKSATWTCKVCSRDTAQEFAGMWHFPVICSSRRQETKWGSLWMRTGKTITPKCRGHSETCPNLFSDLECPGKAFWLRTPSCTQFSVRWRSWFKESGFSLGEGGSYIGQIPSWGHWMRDVGTADSRTVLFHRDSALRSPSQDPNIPGLMWFTLPSMWEVSTRNGTWPEYCNLWSGRVESHNLPGAQ